MRLERTSFAKRLAGYAEAIDLPSQPVVEGRLLRMVGLTLEAEGLRAALGSRCLVINDDSYHPVQVEAEVMGFSAGKIYLMPVGSLAGIAPGARVVPLPDTGRLPMGMSMLVYTVILPKCGGTYNQAFLTAACNITLIVAAIGTLLVCLGGVLLHPNIPLLTTLHHNPLDYLGYGLVNAPKLEVV